MTCEDCGVGKNIHDLVHPQILGMRNLATGTGKVAQNYGLKIVKLLKGFHYCKLLDLPKQNFLCSLSMNKVKLGYAHHHFGLQRKKVNTMTKLPKRDTINQVKQMEKIHD
jgi:hypothetical protein